MKKNKLLLILLSAVLVLSGCSDDEATEGLNSAGQNAASGINDASTSGLGGAGTSALTGMAGAGYTGVTGNNAFLGPEFSDPNNPLSRSTIYFVYDSSEVQPDFIPVINAHAKYLVGHPSQRMTLEGHADERGSPEYNIALGDQRAKAVSELLKAQGVAESQLQLVSYGEEKPAVMGSDESAFERNRRVEINYQR